MRRPRPLLIMAVVLALLTTAIAGITVTTKAQVQHPSLLTTDANECYLASVTNGGNIGLGSAQTSVTIQNVSDQAATAFIFAGSPTGLKTAGYVDLPPFGSQTVTPMTMSIQSGATVPVVVTAYKSGVGTNFSQANQVPINCVAKQATNGLNLPNTSSINSAVSGYNGVGGLEVDAFDSIFLPIVQTNCGPGGCWDSHIRVANAAPTAEVVTIKFHPADGSASAVAGGFQLTPTIAGGQTWSLRLSTMVQPGWVGSAEIVTMGRSIFATVDRVKPGTNMWIANNAAGPTLPSSTTIPGVPGGAPYILYVPDARLDFSRWNTGISITNLSDFSNLVTVHYVGRDGTAPRQASMTITPHSMGYFYNRSSATDSSCPLPIGGVATCDWVGAAVIVGQAPIAAAIDGVKYSGTGGDAGHAFSYVATGNLYSFLSAPLIQKGNSNSGMGPTSGMSFINPNPVSVSVTAHWLRPNGTSQGSNTINLQAHASGYIYSIDQAFVPTGFLGSVVITSDRPISGTTGNVDYAVNGDGAAYWTLNNPCGMYRLVPGCDLTYTPPVAPTATVPGSTPAATVTTAPNATATVAAPTSVPATATINPYESGQLVVHLCGDVNLSADTKCIGPVKDLSVTLTNSDNLSTNHLTNEIGSFSVKSLAGGNYRVCWEDLTDRPMPVLAGCASFLHNDNSVEYIKITPGAWLDVCVADGGATPKTGIIGAAVTVRYDGFTRTAYTDVSGQVSLPAPTDPTKSSLTIAASGFTSVTNKTAKELDSTLEAVNPARGACAATEADGEDPASFSKGTADLFVELVRAGDASTRPNGFALTLLWNDQPPTTTHTVRVYAMVGGVCPDLMADDVDYLVTAVTNANGRVDLVGNPTPLPTGAKYCLAVSPGVFADAEKPDLLSKMFGPYTLPGATTGLVPQTINLNEHFGTMNLEIYLYPGMRTDIDSWTLKVFYGGLTGANCAATDPAFTEVVAGPFQETYKRLIPMPSGAYCVDVTGEPKAGSTNNYFVKKAVTVAPGPAPTIATNLSPD